MKDQRKRGIGGGRERETRKMEEERDRGGKDSKAD